MSTLEIKNLNIYFKTKTGIVHAVQDFNLNINPGEAVGLIGQSGSGKSATGLAILRLLDDTTADVSGEILFGGENLLKMRSKDLRQVRGLQIAMIFQEPMTSLNPLMTVGAQVAEVLKAHGLMNSKKAQEMARSRLAEVGLPDRVEGAYPHELSGGQRQRVVIAMAIAAGPRLLIADEPTTALDVTVERHILALIRNLQKKYGMGLLLIGHDLALVEAVTDSVAVLHQGQIVERGRSVDVFKNPRHEYTRRLLTPAPARAPRVATGELILQVNNVSCRYPSRRRLLKKQESVHALRGVSLQIRRGETFGLVGESGSGKTTLGRAILNLMTPSSGHVLFAGEDVTQVQGAGLKALRRRMQIVFQDPNSSLNPRLTVGQALTEPMLAHGIGLTDKERLNLAEQLLLKVGLEVSACERYPHEFSGGQRQRIAIARALAVRPELIICDEAVSALDISTKRQILDLLKNLQEEFGLTYLFISHDLEVIRSMANHVAVMKEGHVVEQGPVEDVFAHPQHPYTKELLAVRGGFR